MPNCFPVLLFLFLLWLLKIDDRFVTFVFASSGPGTRLDTQWAVKEKNCHCSVEMSQSSFQRPLPPCWTPWTMPTRFESSFHWAPLWLHASPVALLVLQCTRVYTHAEDSSRGCRSSCHMVKLYYMLISVLGTYIPYLIEPSLNLMRWALLSPLHRQGKQGLELVRDHAGVWLHHSLAPKPIHSSFHVFLIVSPASLDFPPLNPLTWGSAHSSPAMNICWIEMN